jgi:NDP-sugar pyrophosphorylase family protein
MTAGPEFTGVILAGGQGTRMLPFSETYPKPLLPIANEPLLQRQIEAAQARVELETRAGVLR